MKTSSRDGASLSELHHTAGRSVISPQLKNLEKIFGSSLFKLAGLFWGRSKEQQPKELSKRTMSQSSSPPRLSPKFCFNEKALRDFLRTSRGMVDDTVVQHLNALVTPSREVFDSSTTANRQTQPSSKKPIDARSCEAFKNDLLFQSWQSRSDVLSYCAGVALDPNDPDLFLRDVESAKERERVVDERLDPYSSRHFPREARTESLANLIRNERSVEAIVRARTWGVLSERCGDPGLRWEEAMNVWRAQKESRSKSQ